MCISRMENSGSEGRFYCTSINLYLARSISLCIYWPRQYFYDLLNMLRSHLSRMVAPNRASNGF